MSVIEVNDKRIIFVPIDKAITPPAGLINHIKDSWWTCHPEKGLVYWVGPNGKNYSPQCNRSREIAENFSKGMYPWAEIVFLPSVFHTINPQDYY